MLFNNMKIARQIQSTLRAFTIGQEHCQARTDFGQRVTAAKKK